MTAPAGSGASPARDRDGIEVTIKDLAAGTSETVIVRDDYLIITAGSMGVASVQRYANGTHVLTVKRGHHD